MGFNRFDFFGPMNRNIAATRKKRAAYLRQLEKDLYTVPEAAELMDMHPKTLYRWIREGAVKDSGPSPRKKRVSSNDIARYWYPGWTAPFVDEDLENEDLEKF